jgi:hypothetical protein
LIVTVAWFCGNTVDPAEVVIVHTWLGATPETTPGGTSARHIAAVKVAVIGCTQVVVVVVVVKPVGQGAPQFAVPATAAGLPTVPVAQIGLAVPEQSMDVPLPSATPAQDEALMLTEDPVVASCTDAWTL